MATRPFDGWTVLNFAGNVSGNGGLSAVQRTIIVTQGIPMNPDNKSYQGVVNNTSYPSTATLGMRTPSVRLTACMKPADNTASPNTIGWADAGIFNSLLNVNTSTQQTDQVDCFFKDDTSTQRLWGWGRCEMVQFQWDAVGGPCMVTMGFKNRFGDAIAEAVYGKTFVDTNFNPGSVPTITAPSGADAGQLTNDAQIDFAGTLSDVSRFTLTLLRGQRWRSRAGSYYNNASAPGHILYPAEIDSGMFSGVLTVDQDPDAATTVETTNGTVTINFNTDKTSATGRFKIDMKVDRNNKVYPVEAGFGNITRTYSLVNLTTGGNPAVFTSF